ncbi:MAG TPA: SpoIID/LytB domain-containing protein, partial [Candidatus Limnocylindrales bacterium]
MAVAHSPSPASTGAFPSRRRLGRIIRIFVATLVASSTAIAPTSDAGAASRTVIPRPGSLDAMTFHGRGYGHGVGMSQYGARGRALAGQLAPAILAHYYPSTTLGSRSGTTLVRVLVLTGVAASTTKPAVVTGRGGPWTIDAIGGTFPPDARLLLAPTAPGASTWAARVVSSAGASLASATVSSGLVARPASTSSLLQLTSKPSASNVYRGELRLRLTTTVSVVNALGLDLYVRGVVPAEMPSSWPVEALKAQAIAARSYALYRLHPTTGAYDLFDDTRSQVYRGRNAETTTSNAAVAATAGLTLLRGSTPANALYHSADGGWTENNENVFVSSSGSIVSGAVAYLRGSSDRAP